MITIIIQEKEENSFAPKVQKRKYVIRERVSQDHNRNVCTYIMRTILVVTVIVVAAVISSSTHHANYYIYIYTHIYICYMYTFITCICICTYIYIYIYIYICNSFTFV